MAACTPSIPIFLGRPLFLLPHGIHSIINFGILTSGVLLTWPYHCSLFLSMMSVMSGFPFSIKEGYLQLRTLIGNLLLLHLHSALHLLWHHMVFAQNDIFIGWLFIQRKWERTSNLIPLAWSTHFSRLSTRSCAVHWSKHVFSFLLLCTHNEY